MIYCLRSNREHIERPIRETAAAALLQKTHFYYIAHDVYVYLIRIIINSPYILGLCTTERWYIWTFCLVARVIDDVGQRKIVRSFRKVSYI